MASVIGRYLPGSVVQDDRGHGRLGSRVLGEEHGELGLVQLAAEPANGGEEDELELRDDWACEPQEHVVEPAVLEVVLDARSADPPGQAVDDDDLAVVDVPELVEVPALLAFCSERAADGARLRRAHDVDLDTAVEQALVERAARTVGVRPLPVDDHAHADALGGLREQRRRERLTDLAGPEAELVDVDRARRRRDVVEHGRVEVPPLDVDARGGRGRLLEGECERRQLHGRPQEPGCVATDVGVGDRGGRARPHGAARYALRRTTSAASRRSASAARPTTHGRPTRRQLCP